MSRHRFFPQWTARGGVIAAIVVCALGGTAPAMAGCGDWLRDHASAPLPSYGERTTPVVPPCHGTSCRQTPLDQLPSVPLVVNGDQQERSCIWSSTSELRHQRCEMWRQADDPVTPSVIRDRIDRPPRS